MAIRAVLLLTVCLAWGTAGSARAADPTAAPQADSAADTRDATELPTITVNPPAVNPLDESLERLRAMMESAPCLGSCAAPAEQDVYDKARAVIGQLTGLTAYPIEPPNPDLEQRQGDRLANEYRVSDWGPEMQDFR